MEKRKDIVDELKGIAPDMPSNGGMPDFALPENYFSGLAERVMQRLNIRRAEEAQAETEMLSPLLADIPKAPAYAIPDGYFEGLAEDIAGRAGREAVSLPSVPAPHTVPDGYFEGLAERIAARAIGEGAAVRETPVVPLGRRRPVLWKYLAAAAVTAGIIITSVTLHVHHSQPQSLDYQLAKVSDEAIEQYLQDHTSVFDDESLYNNVSIDSTEFMNNINGLSSNDIQEYFESDADMADTTLN